MIRRRPKAEPEPEPGDPDAAIRMVNGRGNLRVQIGSQDIALRIVDIDDDRWIEIDWDGTITTGRNERV